MTRDQRAYCRDILDRLDEDLLEQAPHIAWRDFTGFRNMLIRKYHRIKLDLVWDFAQEDLPPLKAAVTALLKNLETGDDAAKG